MDFVYFEHDSDHVFNFNQVNGIFCKGL